MKFCHSVFFGKRFHFINNILCRACSPALFVCIWNNTERAGIRTSARRQQWQIFFCSKRSVRIGKFPIIFKSEEIPRRKRKNIWILDNLFFFIMKNFSCRITIDQSINFSKKMLFFLRISLSKSMKQCNCAKFRFSGKNIVNRFFEECVCNSLE